MPARMEFTVNLPRSAPPAQPVAADAPLRILVMADFSGRSQREPAANRLDLDNRPLLDVDVDTLDAVMARLAPQLRLPVAGGSVTVSFHQLDDFHPDALYQRLDLFQALRRSRARLLNPASFAQAVAELSPAPVADVVTTHPPARHEADAELLNRLLGRPPAATEVRAMPRETESATMLDGLLRTLVQPHIVYSDPRQSAWVDAVDAAIGDQLRALLHQPAFQELEAAWRGVHGLVSGLESDAVRITLLDLSWQELLADLRTAGGVPEASGLYARLIDRDARLADGQPWSLLVADYTFGNAPEDIALLALLGAVAARAGGPLLAAADPGLPGCTTVADLADPGRWTPPSDVNARNWQALRHCAVAPWLGLALPRILLRLPYGAKTDALEHLSFEEMPLGRDPRAYLWGNPAFACARLIATAFVEQGGDFYPGAVQQLDDLPAHIYEQEGERLMQPATEVLLGERAALALLDQGLMPLLGFRQRNALRLARVQSLAEPATELAGRWSLQDHR